MTTTETVEAVMFVPGGIRPDDHVHHGQNDNSCSRCRWTVPNNEAPLIVSLPGGDKLIYCNTCRGVDDQ